jgi:hypothetical protein
VHDTHIEGWLSHKEVERPGCLDGALVCEGANARTPERHSGRLRSPRLAAMRTASSFEHAPSLSMAEASQARTVSGDAHIA